MEKCTIVVDASNAVARVLFSDSDELGVLINEYKVGDVITIPEGEKQEITVYNGKDESSLAFELGFSGALGLQFKIALASAIGSYLLY